MKSTKFRYITSLIRSHVFKRDFFKMCENQTTLISEGLANIKTKGKVFYNPVQEFNRDLSITVLNEFAKLYTAERNGSQGLRMLEALSATGLRSIRYAKEVENVAEIIANDYSIQAFNDIQQNIIDNDVQQIVKASNEDAAMLMYKSRKNNRFDVIDLDPYGSPSIFLDSCVQAVADGGMLLVTATDMAVLAGNTPETCYSKYGAVSLRMKSCHEMALRILLQCIESHANRYGRYIVPVLSLSADFYIRVFVRVFSGAHHCKFTLSKLSRVYNCTGCGSFKLVPLGITKEGKKQTKFGLPTTKDEGPCEHCGHAFHVGGPIWSGSLHQRDFIDKLYASLNMKLATFKRIQGVLGVISEEIDAPLYYTLEQLSGTLHLETPSMLAVRSAILNAGYDVSCTHMNKTSIKTTAPTQFLWDIMRTWAKTHPVSEKRLHENSPAKNILEKAIKTECSFDLNPLAKSQSQKQGLVRFQQNPQPNWGPGMRATAMVGNTLEKRQRNQNKRKRDEQSMDEVAENH